MDKVEYLEVIESIKKKIFSFFLKTQQRVVKPYNHTKRNYGIYFRFFCKEFFSSNSPKRRTTNVKCKKMYVVNYFNSDEIIITDIADECCDHKSENNVLCTSLDESILLD